MTTMRDVAKKAGVGVGTVSRALSDTGYTAKATREKIFAAADEMGYEYESPGRVPVKAITIGIMLPLLRHPFFQEYPMPLKRSCTSAASGACSMITAITSSTREKP